MQPHNSEYDVKPKNNKVARYSIYMYMYAYGDGWSISGHLLWQEQWYKTNKLWCHQAMHGMHLVLSTSQPYAHIFFTSLRGTCNSFNYLLIKSSVQWNVSWLCYKHSSQDNNFLSISCSCRVEEASWVAAATDCVCTLWSILPWYCQYYFYTHLSTRLGTVLTLIITVG